MVCVVITSLGVCLNYHTRKWSTVGSRVSDVWFYLCLLRLSGWFILILIEMTQSRTRKWTLRNCSWETKIFFFFFSRNRKILLILTGLPWNWSSLSPATSPWCSLPLLNSHALCFGAWAQATSLHSIAFAFKCLVFSSRFQNCWG